MIGLEGCCGKSRSFVVKDIKGKSVWTVIVDSKETVIGCDRSESNEENKRVDG